MQHNLCSIIWSKQRKLITENNHQWCKNAINFYLYKYINCHCSYNNGYRNSEDITFIQDASIYKYACICRVFNELQWCGMPVIASVTLYYPVLPCPAMLSCERAREHKEQTHEAQQCFVVDLYYSAVQLQTSLPNCAQEQLSRCWSPQFSLDRRGINGTL